MKSQLNFFFSKSDKVRAGYGSVFLLLLVTLGLSLYNVRIYIGQAKSMNGTNTVIAGLETVASNLKDAETALRGYIIMKDTIFLEPYNGTRKKVDALFDLLKSADDLDAVQKKNITELKISSDARFDGFDKSLRLFEQQDRVINDSLKFLIGEGKIMMDRLRTMIADYQRTEKSIMSDRTAAMKNTSNSLQIIIISSLAVCLLLAYYSIRTYTKENNARTRADGVADEYRSKLEQQLEQQRKVNEELISLRRDERFASTGRIARTIAHEVRNPLTNINLAVEQLKEDVGGNEDAMPLLDMVNRNSARINQLVTELLNSTRFSELSFQKRNINQIADEALDMAADRIELKRIQVKKNYSEDICEIDVDADKIKIAFLNIIVNAIEAMESHTGILTIDTKGEKDQCVIAISDNGHGMDEEGLQRLFEPYFTKKPKGNGLGMTNTQNIILNHKGTIQVESAEGKGTTFTIALRFPAEWV